MRYHNFNAVSRRLGMNIVDAAAAAAAFCISKQSIQDNTGSSVLPGGVWPAAAAAAVA